MGLLMTTDLGQLDGEPASTVGVGEGSGQRAQHQAGTVLRHTPAKTASTVSQTLASCPLLPQISHQTQEGPC